MAKKKTENIKAAPVLRAQSDEQPTPTPEQTGTRTYQIMDPWKDRDMVNLVDVKAVDGEITEVKVNGVPAGGGGGGDFSTAEVTIINNTGGPINVWMPTVDTNYSYGQTSDSSNVEAGTHIFNVIVYKNGAKLVPYGKGLTITITGSITFAELWYIVTGDCTITIS